MRNKNMTAVEWLQSIDLEKDLDLGHWNRAKAMEKEQIMNAVDIGFEEGCKFPEDIKLNNSEQYYNETYEQ